MFASDILSLLMFMRTLRNVFLLAAFVFLGSASFVRAVATLNGSCDAPVEGKQCLDMTGVSPADRTARGCETGRCRGLAADVLCCRPAATGAAPAPVSDACGTTIAAMGSRPTALADVRADWVCRIPPSGPEGERQCRDFDGCHAVNPAGRCCPPSVGTAIGRAPATGTGTGSAPAATDSAPAGGLPGRLGLPNCATTHDPATAGKCTLEDIKQVAINFANFLMGLAAAFFLAIFVWAGFKYIFFAYDPGVAGEARKTLTNAAIGMLLILGAATIVRFTQTVATGRTPKEDRCVAQRGSSYSCQNTARMSVTQRRNCVDNLCDGGTNIKCCPIATGASDGASPASPTPPRP